MSVLRRITRINPMAKDLMHPKYKPRVIPDKKKPKPSRKAKHKSKDKLND